MALTLLTPTPLGKAQALVNVSSLLASLGANTGVYFPNTGKEILVISMGTTAANISTPINFTVQGAAVGSVSAGALGTSAISMLGPWSSQFDRTDGTFDVEVDFSSSAGISVALVQYTPVS